MGMSDFISHARILRVDRHFQATNATLCGAVTIGEDVSFWFGVTVRGDVAPIRIGRCTNVQDLACLHCDTGVPLDIGDAVTIGHGAVVHGRSVGDGALIGMKAVVLGGAVIGKEAIVAAGCVVPPNAVVPDGMVIRGVPGRVVRAVRAAELAAMGENNGHYVELARRHVADPTAFYRG